MNKALFSFLLLLLIAASAQAQSVMPLYTGVYYKLTSNVTAFRVFSDTAIVAPDKPLFPPVSLRAKEELLVMAFPTARWAQIVKGGVWCYVPTKLLLPLEKPMAESSPAKIGAPAGTSNYNPPANTSPAPTSGSGNTGGYQTIHIGPRGGQYYINSNGNKTYKKRK
jgi:hypothetical protein